MIAVTSEAAGTRLDRFLVEHTPGVSRARLQKLIQSAAVLVNGRGARASRVLREGDEVQITRLAEVASRGALKPQTIPLSIVFEDDDLMVLDKPAGLVVHPSETLREGTLVNALLARGGPLSTVGGLERPGIVHRLDKDTTGLLIVAKDDDAHTTLANALRRHEIRRHYVAVAWGRFPRATGSLAGDIGRDERRRTRMTVRATGGRSAKTHYEVRRAFAWATELALSLETGRTHQIRVHLAHDGHPVFGDPVYGGRRVPGSLGAPSVREARALLDRFRRPALHAARLEFRHPRTGAAMRFEAPLPEDLLVLLAGLGAAR